MAVQASVNSIFEFAQFEYSDTRHCFIHKFIYKERELTAYFKPGY